MKPEIVSETAHPTEDFDPGIKALRDAWVERVLHVKVGHVSVSPVLLKRLEALQPRISALPDGGRFHDDMMTAALALRAGLPNAEGEIALLEGRIASAERAAGAGSEIAEAASRVSAKVVAFAKVRLRWNAVQASRIIAISRLQQVMAEVLDAEFTEHPQISQARAQVVALDGMLPHPPEALDDALDELAGATDPAKARAEVLRLISNYRAELRKATILSDLQSTEYGNYKIYDEITSALQALETILTA